MGKIIDMTGQILKSGIYVIEYAGKNKQNSAMWKCKCVCGKEFICRGSDLRNGHTKSCGCLSLKRVTKMGKINTHKIKDLTGQRFGKLTVIEDTGKRASDRTVIWKCQCDCGNIKEISSHCLKKGTLSCGCVNSKGELKIGQLLLEANIPFETQKTFEDLRFDDINALAKFDFYVNNQYLIEFDGIQHFDSRFGWNNEEIYKKTQTHDEIKNQWCKENNIPLIRIPYTHYDKLVLTDLLLDKTQFKM